MSSNKYYIVGLGRSGIATAGYLVSRRADKVCAWDDSKNARDNFSKKYPQIRMVDGLNYDWHSPGEVILAPGIPHTFPQAHLIAHKAKQQGHPLISDVELYVKAYSKRDMIGVTGTNGKSTTTLLISHILNALGVQAKAGGNLGVSVFSMPDHAVSVLELSSFQLELMKTQSLLGCVLLNISPDHLERHGGMQGYIRAKEYIFSLLKPGAIGVLCVDDEYTRALFDKFQASGPKFLLPVSTQRAIKGGFYVANGQVWDWRKASAKSCFALPEVSTLAGKHNRQNVLASYALIKSLFECRDSDFIKALKTFPGAPHRQEHILKKHNIVCINDSKATNTNAALQALDRFDNILWLVGGEFKEAVEDLESMKQFLKKVRKIYAYGASGRLFHQIFSSVVETSLHKNLNLATKAAFNDAKTCPSESCILLSPACASFDAYNNFEERGDHFRTLCHALSKET